MSPEFQFRRHTALRLLIIFVVLAANLAFAQNVHPTSTPIKHVVIIFQENVSFDHYFAT